MRLRPAIALLLVATLALACKPRPEQQQALIYATSFENCTEWTGSASTLGDNNVCQPGDGISGNGGWSTADGRWDQITAAANNPLGPGLGMRHWRGGASASAPMGQNNNGGGIKIELPEKDLSKQPRNIWIRYYMRYQQGFAWQYINYTKELYVNVGRTSGPVFTTAFSSTDSFGMGIVYPSQPTGFGGSPGWATTMGSMVGDGKWHAYEVHVDVLGGILEAWVDGVLSARATGRNLGTMGIGWLTVGSNQCCVAVQPDMYTDFDDFAFSTTGYIGPIGPAPPAPLTIVCPVDVTTQAPDLKGAIVTYPPATTQGGTAPVAVTYAPASGALYPVGTTTVKADATDAAKGTASCTFTVGVNPPTPPTPSGCREQVTRIVGGALENTCTASS